MRAGNQYPRVNGYCNVSEVLKTGNDCPNISAGDHILTFSCHCSHFIAHIDDILSIIPDSVSLSDASLAYLFHLGYSSIITANSPPGTSCAILGLGALGITTYQMSLLNGWNSVGISDYTQLLNENNITGNGKIINRSQVLFDKLFDIVIYASTSWSDWELALQLASQRAKIIVLGFPGRGYELTDLRFNPFRPDLFYQKQLSITATGLMPESNCSRSFNKFNERSNLERILCWFADKTLNPKLLVAPVRSCLDLDDLYDTLTLNRNSHTYILDWSYFT